ncbi:MAG TPA: 6-carboxytetrahydropterin synthase QueD [bacterium]|mgnify:FL=1|nr:6-carboxytetrahydropterin synthase QueD [bacterium]HPP86663.1 6-carboxytetrahydropterin synthase QueD [bacterium]
MFLVTKIFKFDSAHNLLNYKGACENVHGHTYNLEVSLKCSKDKNNGLAFDFNLIKEIVNKKIIDKLDHRYLNEIINQPTAENICEWIWSELITEFTTDNVKLFEIKLYEGPNSYITYRGAADF